jgi:AraC family transcriptional regulator
MNHMSANDRPSAMPGHPDPECFGNIKFPAEAIQMLHAIRSELGRNREGARTAALQLAELLTIPTTLEPAAARGGLAPWQKGKVDRYLRERIAHPAPVHEIAQHVSLSASHFSRAFRETFGVSPHVYVIRLRMERAQRLLLDSDESLDEIAVACGFSDQTHFCRCFRREIGQPPGRWRRLHATGRR